MRINYKRITNITVLVLIFFISIVSDVVITD